MQVEWQEYPAFAFEAKDIPFATFKHRTNQTQELFLHQLLRLGSSNPVPDTNVDELMAAKN